MSHSFPIIKSGRVLLRQFTDSDLTNVFQGLSNPEVIKYYGVRYDSLEATKEQMLWFTHLETTGTGIWWAVCSPDNQNFYGAGGLNNIAKQHRKAEIGFWLLPPFWGQGMLKEILPLICRHGFDRLALHRIEALVEHDNLNCKRALAKSGFTYEGTMIDCEIKDGKFISLDIYAQLNDALPLTYEIDQ